MPKSSETPPLKNATPAPPRRVINITDRITDIIAEIIRTVPLYAYIDPHRLLVCLATNRSNARGATFGKLVPLRFKNGVPIIMHRRTWYCMPRIMHNGVELSYLVYFFVPRFLDLAPAEKLRVIFHELYHISPLFNGDIRRMGEKKASHGSSRKRFDSMFQTEMQRFYQQIAGTPHMVFLEATSASLRREHARVLGRRMKMPRPGPLKN